MAVQTSFLRSEEPITADLGLDSDMSRSTIHPTKAALIDTAAALLRTHKVHEITVDMVLAESKISKGSLYHHFEDLSDLIEVSMLERYARWVEVSVGVMTQILTSATSAKDIYRGLVEVTKQTQSPDRKSERLYRAEVLTMAAASPRLGAQIAILQQELTDAFTDLIREAQERGFYKKNLDPKAIAVFIQAYTLGKVIDDVSANPVDAESYADLINTIIKDVFIEEQ